MTYRNAVWVDLMGAPTTIVEVDDDALARTVTVSADDRAGMVKGVREAGVLDADAEDNFVAAILGVVPGPDGRYDVTDVGGGYERWKEQFCD